MTLNEAFNEFINSPEFKEIAKEKDSKGGKYRLYLSYHKKGKLKEGAIVSLLMDNGYEINAKRIHKRK